MIDLRAHLIAETGRRNNLLIPPNTLRWVRTDFFASQPNTVHVVLSNDELMIKSVFVPSHMFCMDEEKRIMVPLYNGGSQSFYVQHEMIIACLLIYPGMSE